MPRIISRTHACEQDVLKVPAWIEAGLDDHLLEAVIPHLLLAQQVLAEIRTARFGYVDTSNHVHSRRHERE
jgi:hypothetical protein